MTKDKLTDLIKLKRLKQVDIATDFNMSKASFNNKLCASETRFNLSDLMKLAKITGTHLAFIDDNKKVIVEFEESDLES